MSFIAQGKSGNWDHTQRENLRESIIDGVFVSE